MKPTAYFINIGRGKIVQLAALERALSEGWIGGAGLDVFETEPLPTESPLWAMENVTITPHSAGYGPHIELHVAFPRRTNVQFMQVMDRANVRIEIWERGAGYTLASGSSSCAAAAAAVRTRRADPGRIRVIMPGGELIVDVRNDWPLRRGDVPPDEANRVLYQYRSRQDRPTRRAGTRAE